MSNEIYKYEPLWDSWKVNELLGTGSIGNVYKISKTIVDKEYISAVKFMTVPTDEQYKEFINSNSNAEKSLSEKYFNNVVNSIINEVDLLYKLKGHSNIISYEDHMVKKDEHLPKWHILIRMEYATSLKDYMKENPLNENEIIKIALDMCDALIKCHSNGILHRDIKEANIFRSTTGDYKLGDFSVSRSMDDSTHAQTRVGTMNYMPPEILHGTQYNQNVDIYSLGIVLYKLLNKGRLPFMPYFPEEFTPNDVQNSQIQRMSGKPFNLPLAGSSELVKTVLKACSFKPEHRYQSAEEMKNDLLMLNDPSVVFKENNTASFVNDATFSIQNINQATPENTNTQMETTENDTTSGVFNISRPKRKNFKPIAIFSASGILVFGLIVGGFIINNKLHSPLPQTSPVVKASSKSTANTVSTSKSVNKETLDNSTLPISAIYKKSEKVKGYQVFYTVDSVESKTEDNNNVITINMSVENRTSEKFSMPDNIFWLRSDDSIYNHTGWLSNKEIKGNATSNYKLNFNIPKDKKNLKLEIRDLGNGSNDAIRILTVNLDMDKQASTQTKLYKYKTGEKIVYDKFSYTVNSTKKDNGSDNFKPAKDNTFYMVNMTVENKSDNKISLNFNPDYDVRVVDSDSLRYNAFIPPHPPYDKRLAMDLTSKNTTITGFAGFEIPASKKGLQLEILVDNGSSTKKKILVVELKQ